MKNYIPSRLISLLLAGAGLLAIATSSHAQTFHVDISTAVLNSPANVAHGPFLLDLQLNSGNTLNNNTALVNHFTFGGGGAPFGPASFLGGATGSLASSVTLSDTLAFNEFYQSFSAGSLLSFDVTLTRSADAGSTPDIFSIALLDNALFNITTTGFADQLASVNLPASLATFQVFSGTGDYAGVRIAVTPVPEPSTYGLAAGALLVVGVMIKRRRGQKAPVV